MVIKGNGNTQNTSEKSNEEDDTGGDDVLVRLRVCYGSAVPHRYTRSTKRGVVDARPEKRSSLVPREGERGDKRRHIQTHKEKMLEVSSSSTFSFSSLLRHAQSGARGRKRPQS